MNKCIYLFRDSTGFIKSHDLKCSVGFSANNQFHKEKNERLKKNLNGYVEMKNTVSEIFFKNTLDRINTVDYTLPKTRSMKLKT